MSLVCTQCFSLCFQGPDRFCHSVQQKQLVAVMSQMLDDDIIGSFAKVEATIGRA